jgi:beta-galactosidase
VQVRTSRQPGVISEACGIHYSLFVEPKKVTLKNNPFEVAPEDNQVDTWMELITPTTAEVLAYYDHPHWGKYAAITQNRYGQGTATYIGCIVSPAVIRELFSSVAKKAGVWGVDQETSYPIIVKSGTNELGRTIRYYFNYSEQAGSVVYPHGDGKELIGGRTVIQGQTLPLEPWGVIIIEEA